MLEIAEYILLVLPGPLFLFFLIANSVLSLIQSVTDRVEREKKADQFKLILMIAFRSFMATTVTLLLSFLLLLVSLLLKFLLVAIEGLL